MPAAKGSARTPLGPTISGIRRFSPLVGCQHEKCLAFTICLFSGHASGFAVNAKTINKKTVEF